MDRESEEKALAEIAERLDEGGLLEKMKAIYPLIGGYAEKTICFDLKGSMLVKSILRKRSISKMEIICQ